MKKPKHSRKENGFLPKESEVIIKIKKFPGMSEYLLLQQELGTHSGLIGNILPMPSARGCILIVMKEEAAQHLHPSRQHVTSVLEYSWRKHGVLVLGGCGGEERKYRPAESGEVGVILSVKPMSLFSGLTITKLFVLRVSIF
ncbi:threonylcarbamoyladenosine tRNA methylthiotransferase [Platysternon megacephalum]|uniref:Threonylcarbamoyladenosine tRNA methylthiotransferase n=1 Tax=Platysternon megacephalum TaxID=55544 RepID=A0A4D9EC58_9SAUR|nr:threonylcarbamoyladenosine tRNA methylthiotransferase [Platysternon megacephalum]